MIAGDSYDNSLTEFESSGQKLFMPFVKDVEGPAQSRCPVDSFPGRPHLCQPVSLRLLGRVVIGLFDK